MAGNRNGERRRDYARLLGAVVCGSLAAVACYVDMSNNWKFGQAMSPELGLTMAVAAVALTLLPSCKPLIGGGVRVVVNIGIVIAFVATVLAALSAHLDKQAAERLHREAITSRHATAKQAEGEALRDIAQAERDAAAAGETTSAKDLRQLADGRDADARREAGNKFCGNTCQGYQREANAYRERAGRADARDAAMQRLADARKRLEEARKGAEGGKVESSALAAQLALKTGKSAEESAQDVEMLTAIISVMLTVALALLGEPAVVLWRDGWGGRRRSPAMPEPTIMQRVVEVATKGPAARRGRPPLTLEDRVKQFAEKKLAVGKGEIGGEEMYAAFAGWWKRTCPGKDLPSMQVVSEKLQAAGITRKRKSRGSVYQAALLQ